MSVYQRVVLCQDKAIFQFHDDGRSTNEELKTSDVNQCHWFKHSAVANQKPRPSDEDFSPPAVMGHP